MRTTLLLLLAFITVLAAWLHVGRYAMREAWAIYETTANDLYGRPARRPPADRQAPPALIGAEAILGQYAYLEAPQAG